MSKVRIPLPLAGHCQCGHIAYEVSIRPKALYACYCSECQRQSSSGFGLSMPVEKAGFQIVEGAVSIWTRHAASGRKVNCAICPNCGTRIYHAPQRNTAILNVKPGTLEDTSWISPVAHLWTRSAQKWISIPEGAISYPGQPESFDQIFAAWDENYE